MSRMKVRPPSEEKFSLGSALCALEGQRSQKKLFGLLSISKHKRCAILSKIRVNLENYLHAYCTFFPVTIRAE